MKLIRNLSLLLSSLLLFSYSCSGPSTVVTGTWNKDNQEKTYDDIMVAALTSSENSKFTIENEMVQNLREEGVDAEQSMNKISSEIINDNKQQEEMLNTIRDEGTDAILTVSIIDKNTETRFVPGTTPAYSPLAYNGYYGTFWDYYNYWYPQVGTPGYYTQDKVYFMETNLYDAETEELVWSAQSRTYNPEDLQNFSDDFAEEIIDQLEDENIIL